MSKRSSMNSEPAIPASTWCHWRRVSGLTRSSNRLARMGWDMRGVAGSATAAGVDLLHMTRFAAPLRFDGPLVVTVHDLIPLQLPEYRASRPARIQSELARRTVPRATRIIVPSAYVAGVVEELLGIDHDRIDVIPMGVGSPGRTKPSRDSYRAVHPAYRRLRCAQESSGCCCARSRTRGASSDLDGGWSWLARRIAAIQPSTRRSHR